MEGITQNLTLGCYPRIKAPKGIKKAHTACAAFFCNALSDNHGIQHCLQRDKNRRGSIVVEGFAFCLPLCPSPIIIGDLSPSANYEITIRGIILVSLNLTTPFSLSYAPKGIKKALSYAQQGIKAAHTALFPWQPCFAFEGINPSRLPREKSKVRDKAFFIPLGA